MYLMGHKVRTQCIHAVSPWSDCLHEQSEFLINALNEETGPFSSFLEKSAGWAD